jgi:hypothetical protein
MVNGRVADPHQFKADPDPGFHLNANANPDPAFHSNAVLSHCYEFLICFIFFGGLECVGHSFAYVALSVLF